MDYVVADVTALPRVPQRGDQVTLVGKQGAKRIPLEEQARKAGLIPYALACGLGPRLGRITRGVVAAPLSAPLRDRRRRVA